MGLCVCDTFSSNGELIPNRINKLVKAQKTGKDILASCTSLQDPLLFTKGSECTGVMKMPTRNDRD